MPDLNQQLPEVIVADATTRGIVSHGVRSGTVRKLASGLYTSNLTDTPDAIVRRNLWQIVGHAVPGALIADRTALELQPAPDGSVFVISNRTRAIRLPGLIIRSRKGVAVLPDDKPFLERLHLCSQARAYLENMRTAPARGNGAARTLSKREVEERLELLLRRSGEAALSQLRDDARRLSTTLKLEREFARLDALLGTPLGTRDESMVSEVGMARRMGEPYDPERLQLFEVLHRALYQTPPITRPATSVGIEALAFFEAYFSNFIEGTEFAVREAEDVVFRGKIPADRPADAHDVLGTYQIVADTNEMRRRPERYEDLVLILT